MKKAVVLYLLMMINCTVALAQRINLTGTVISSTENEPVSMATIQLLGNDSTLVGGTHADVNGKFSIGVKSGREYLLKVTSIGFETLWKHIRVQGTESMSLGTIRLKADAVMLKETQIVGQAAKVTVKEDTVIYNAAAYRTPEGAVLEELIKRLPGARISEEGKITINGKEVKKILVDGKEFMTGDTKTAIKNLPTAIVNKVKTYDRKSDMARVSGVDDGEEETVLDFGIKPGMNKGLLVDVDGGMGTHNRYAGKLFGGYFKDNLKLYGIGNANNVNDMSYGGQSGFNNVRSGLNASKLGAVNVNYNHNNKLRLDGSVTWNHQDGDILSRNATERFVSRVGAFSNSVKQNRSRGNRWSGQTLVEWTPDSLTNIMFRANFGINTSDGFSDNRSATFTADPYGYTSDPLGEEGMALLRRDNILVNSGLRRGISYDDNKNARAMVQYYRRLSKKGRGVTVEAYVNMEHGKAYGLSLNDVHLYQVKNSGGLDSTYQTNRYTADPSNRYGYGLQASYSEPLGKSIFLQLRYQLKYGFNKSERSTYDFSNLGENYFEGLDLGYRSWDGYLTHLPHPYTDYLDDKLSRYSEYSNYTHSVSTMLRLNKKNYKLSVGMMFQPQSSHFVQRYQGINVDTVRHVFNIAPVLDLRYQISKMRILRVRYRATTTQPSISQLLDVYDDSDPLNISTGNPGLKPSFTQRLMLFYNHSVPSRLRSLTANVLFTTVSNAISSKVTYNDLTGGRIIRPENINGDWNLAAHLMYNMPIDSAGRWNVSTSTQGAWANHVGYVSVNKRADSEKNITKDLTLEERLAGSYRNAWLEVELDGTLNYRHSTNALLKSGNMNVWQYAYGGQVNVNLPWGMTISTDLHENERRGFQDPSFNTNELIWNMQVSQSLLKNKQLSVMLQFYDLLGNQSNFSRSVTAMQRSDTEYNAVNSFAMLTVKYKLNMFGKFKSTSDSRHTYHGNSGMSGRYGRGNQWSTIRR